jgi:hypothetical protein
MQTEKELRMTDMASEDEMYKQNTSAWSASLITLKAINARHFGREKQSST